MGAVFTCLLLVLPVPRILPWYLDLRELVGLWLNIGLAVKRWNNLEKQLLFCTYLAILGGGILQFFVPI